jgi:hypothetical protein
MWGIIYRLPSRDERPLCVRLRTLDGHGEHRESDNFLLWENRYSRHQVNIILSKYLKVISPSRSRFA